MKNIVLICAGGMSTSILVNKMRAVATDMQYACEINAYGVTEAAKVGANADVILLGPQIRYAINKVKEQCPHCPVESIDMRDYGMMDGKKVLQMAIDLLAKK